VFPFSFSIVEDIPGREVWAAAQHSPWHFARINRLSGDPLDQVALFQLCADLEGHPDNRCPGDLRGFTVVVGSATGLSGCAARRPTFHA